MSATSGEPMTLAVTFVPTSGAAPVTVLVSATSRTRWDEVAPLLPNRLRSTTWYAGGEQVHGEHLLGAPPLLHSVELTDLAQHPPPRTLLELAVAEGPDAGQLRPLAQHTVLGRDPSAQIQVRDPAMSRAHLKIEILHGRAQAQDLGSTNGSLVDDVPITDRAVELRAGQRVRTGGTVSRIVPAAAAHHLPVRAGRRALSRAPRHPPALGEHELVQPRPPVGTDTSIPWLVMLLPIPIAALLAVLLRSPIFLAFAVFSPLLMIGHYLHDRFSGRRERRAQWVDYRERVVLLEQRRQELLAHELRDRRRLAPDLTDLLEQVAAGRCWGRRPGDPDYLLWRVGTGDVAAGVRLRDPEGESSGFTLGQCPIAVPLDQHRVTGLTAPAAVLEPALDAMLGQLVALHSPAILRLIVLSERAHATGRWDWLTWLPHTRPDTTGSPLVLHPVDDDELLTGLLREWSTPPTERFGSAQTPPAHTVVLLDGPGLTQRSLVHELVRHGAAHGVVVVAAADTADGLPPDCTVTVQLDSAGAGRVLGDADTPFAPDLPAAGWRDRLGAGLSPMVDTTPGAQGSEPPSRVRLLDILDEPASAHAIHRRWCSQSRSTEVLLGLGADGPVRIDLVRDGPHALVGGTTGSGKSELLQTLITGLALGNRPQELALLLVDYKGGAAFTDCVELPHVVGLVTDLDPFLTRRALTSLAAEVRRRERILAAVGAKDLVDYQRYSSDGRQSVPRLVLVIDEFRVLAEELPDFIDGLVRLAAVGRSLGIHVVLATQRPAGVVSADIRANVNLRIALRMQDSTDSDDIIESPAAARISVHTPGRALVRTGSTPPVAVQTARVGGSAAAASTVRVLPVDAATGRVAQVAEEPPVDDHQDIRAIVQSLCAAVTLAGDVPVRSPWLPTLPRLIPRATCQRVTRLIGTEGEASDVLAKPLAGDLPVAPLGLLDLPAEQTRATLGWGLTTGHLAIAGGPRSGRTTALRSLVAGLAESWSPDDLHVYVLDQSRSLGALAALPHTGAVISADPDQIRRLLDWCTEEIARRQLLLAAGDEADLAEQRRAGSEPLPYVLIVLDGWDAFQEDHQLSDGTIVDSFVQLLRDGAAVGVLVAISGGRAVFSGRVAGVLTHRLCLRMADEMDLVMAGLRPSDVPRAMPPGRALVLPDAHELQLAVPGTDSTGADQSDAIRAVAAAAAPARHCPPKRFAGLPERVALDDIAAPSGAGLIVGPAGEQAQPIRLTPDPVHGLVALVAEPPRSGRTCALLTLAHQLRDRGPVLWHTGIAGAPTPPWATPAIDTDPDALWARLQAGWHTLVLDDAELAAGGPLDELAVSYLQVCGAGRGALLVAGATADLLTAYRGVSHELRRRQSGLLLQPARADGDLLGVRVPPARGRLPGRGVLVHRGQPTEVQVALPPAEPVAA